MHNEDLEVDSLSTAPKPTRRPRERPETLSQSTESSPAAHLFMHNEDLDKGLGVASPLLYDVQTNVYYAADNTMITDDAITIDILSDADDATVDVHAVFFLYFTFVN